MNQEYTNRGLTAAEVRERTEQGKVNRVPDANRRTVGQIVHAHIFTLFNLLNLLLALMIIGVGSWRNLLFMGVVLTNTVIGIFQELRARKTLDKLSFLTAPRVSVLRDGAELQIDTGELVTDDLMLLRNGDRIVSDSVLLDGYAEVNEALLTGESDPVMKQPGDELRSGSFVVSGSCRVRVVRVGADNYVARLAEKAKEMKPVRSALMDSIRWIIRLVSFIIVPLSALMFCKQYFWLGQDLEAAVVSTVSSAVGMIPEGLVLLTSVSLAVGAVKLARKSALVQEMYSIEALARVDTLCLDKTGTITEGHMRLERLLSLSEEDVRADIAALVHALGDRNPTADALRDAYPDAPIREVSEKLPFSSSRKLSAVRFGSDSFALGAPEFLLQDRGESLRETVRPEAEQGRRVLVFCRCELRDGTVSQTEPLALLSFADPVRPEAAETFRYFRSQDVTVRVISGDSVSTVASVAMAAGLSVEHAADLDGLSDEEVIEIAEQTTVFGRVSPSQKKLLVETLQKNGHTVAMTGDGVNDVLALKAADCSIAMAEGSAAARQVSQLVLLDSDFSVLPGVVAEGRRVVNNMRRAASLYLVKTVYSALLTLCFLFLNTAWPFRPIQMTLIGALTVGIPSFLLALEPNDERVRSDFLPYILTHAVPGALSIVLGVLGMTVASDWLDLIGAQYSTLCALITAAVGFVVLLRVSIPFNKLRAAMFTAMLTAFAGAVLLFGDFFHFRELSLKMIPVLLCGAAAVTLLVFGLAALADRLYERVARHK